jgi:hypothetical protein
MFLEPLVFILKNNTSFRDFTISCLMKPFHLQRYKSQPNGSVGWWGEFLFPHSPFYLSCHFELHTNFEPKSFIAFVLSHSPSLKLRYRNL